MKTIKLNTDECPLVTAVKTGDRGAFSILVSRYRKPIIRICRGYIGCEEDAEDIAQEVFVELYRSVEKFKGDSALSTWLYRIAINKSLNFIRDNQKKYTLLRQSAVVSKEVVEDSDDFDSSDRVIINKDHKKALHQSINRLPGNQKTAFILNKYEDLSYKEIGNILKLTQSSVESLIFRAKQNLQKSLHTYYKENFR